MAKCYITRLKQPQIRFQLVAAQTERDALRTERTRLQQELAFSKDQIHRKTDEYQATLDDLANAHRKAEDGRLNAMQELESRKYELQDVQVGCII